MTILLLISFFHLPSNVKVSHRIMNDSTCSKNLPFTSGFPFCSVRGSENTIVKYVALILPSTGVHHLLHNVTSLKQLIRLFIYPLNSCMSIIELVLFPSVLQCMHDLITTRVYFCYSIHPRPQKQQHKIERIQNKAACIIASIPKAGKLIVSSI